MSTRTVGDTVPKHAAHGSVWYHKIWNEGLLHVVLAAAASNTVLVENQDVEPVLQQQYTAAEASER